MSANGTATAGVGFGDTYELYSLEMVADGAENLYILVEYGGYATTVFGTTLPGAGPPRGYALLKLDAGNQLSWVQGFGSWYTRGVVLSRDAVRYRQTRGNSMGYFDNYVESMDLNGNVQWSFMYEAKTNHPATLAGGMGTDLWLVAAFDGQVQLPGGSASRAEGTFVARFDGSGALKWLRDFPGKLIGVRGVVTSDERLIVAADLDAQSPLDFGHGTFASPWRDVLAMFDYLGKPMGSLPLNRSVGLTLDGADALFVTGETEITTSSLMVGSKTYQPTNASDHWFVMKRTP